MVAAVVVLVAASKTGPVGIINASPRARHFFAVVGLADDFIAD